MLDADPLRDIRNTQKIHAIIHHGKLMTAAERAALAKWARALPKPVGVMCCYDICGQQVLDACRELGLAVPDQVAVVGVDNDELLCELCEPSLSSVDLDSDRAGFEAARLLDGMMRGRAAPREPILIKPLRLVARASTVHPGIADPAVSLALRFIHRHAQQNIRVSQVVAAMGLFDDVVVTESAHRSQPRKR